MAPKQNLKWRIASYALVLIVLYLLQFSRGLPLRFRGAQVDFLPFFIAALALFEGPWMGAGFGFAAGLLCSLGGGTEGLLALYYGLCGLCVGYFSSTYLRRVYPSALLSGAFILLLHDTILFYFYYALLYRARYAAGLEIMGLRLLISAVLSAPVYLILRKIHSRFEEDAPIG